MSDETAPQPRIKITWLIGTLAAFALFVVIGAYSSHMTRVYTDYDQDRAAKRYDTLKKLQQDEGKLINPVDDKGKPTAEWVDQAKGVVRIPIEEAMAMEIDTLKGQPVAMGAVIPPPAPPAPTTNAPAATPPSAGATNAAPAASASTNAPPAKPAAPASTNAVPAASGAGPAPATSKPKKSTP